MQRKTKTDIFIAASILFSFTAFAGLIAAFAQSNGAIGGRAIVNPVANYTLYLFPLVFLPGLLKNNSLILIFLLFAVNIFLYAAILAAIFHGRITKLKNYRPYTFSFYTLISILLFLFSFAIILIIRIL